MTEYPQLQTIVLDATDVRGLAELYRKLLGLRYLPRDEPPTDGAADDHSTDPAGHPFCIFVA